MQRKIALTLITLGFALILVSFLGTSYKILLTGQYSISPALCTDSDNGIEPYTPGTTHLANGKWSDVCTSGGVLEHYCAEKMGQNAHDERIMPCTYGCLDGACTDAPNQHLISYNCTAASFGQCVDTLTRSLALNPVRACPDLHLVGCSTTTNTCRFSSIMCTQPLEGNTCPTGYALEDHAVLGAFCVQKTALYPASALLRAGDPCDTTNDCQPGLQCKLIDQKRICAECTTSLECTTIKQTTTPQRCVQGLCKPAFTQFTLPIPESCTSVCGDSHVVLRQNANRSETDYLPYTLHIGDTFVVTNNHEYTLLRFDDATQPTPSAPFSTLTFIIITNSHYPLRCTRRGQVTIETRGLPAFNLPNGDTKIYGSLPLLHTNVQLSAIIGSNTKLLVDLDANGELGGDTTSTARATGLCPELLAKT